MNYPLVIEQSAKTDLGDIVVWYKKEKPGLESNFQSCLEVTLNRILSHPEIYMVITRQVRRAMVQHFPYSVLYRVEKPSIIRVLAVLHTSRDPGYFQSRSH